MADFSKFNDGTTVYNVKDAAARTALASKLDQVTTMPSSPSDGDTVLFIGTTTATYTKGHVYQYQTNAWADISPAGGGGGTVDQTYDPTSANAQSGTAVAQAITQAVINTTGSSLRISVKPELLLSHWSAKTWSGLTSFYCTYIWTDGTHIYYSKGTDQYVLDVSTSTWSRKTWAGLTSFYGIYIWSDGTHIYYSKGNEQYVLDVSTSTWSTKTWTGLTSIDGDYLWTDGTNIYYGSGTNQYVLDVSTSTWSPKTWSGLTSIDGRSVWTDGTHIYYSKGNEQYVLDVSTSTWSTKTWTGLTSIDGDYLWTDGTHIYYSKGSTQYVLNTATGTSRRT